MTHDEFRVNSLHTAPSHAIGSFIEVHLMRSSSFLYGSRLFNFNGNHEIDGSHGYSLDSLVWGKDNKHISMVHISEHSVDKFIRIRPNHFMSLKRYHIK